MIASFDDKMLAWNVTRHSGLPKDHHTSEPEPSNLSKNINRWMNVPSHPNYVSNWISSIWSWSISITQSNATIPFFEGLVVMPRYQTPHFQLCESIRTLVRSILHTLKALVWAMLLLFLIAPGLSPWRHRLKKRGGKPSGEKGVWWTELFCKGARASTGLLMAARPKTWPLVVQFKAWILKTLPRD